ncbi:hypothetical protein [Methylotetracoccus oryzae]|uniref:hypothetical protein n=1 Tax=Methylotetracoccus oryzae TaxID=1919059 RepID=UPI0011192C9E|nr:hypothetical protein [Methylotetracoccus oryzae]
MIARNLLLFVALSALGGLAQAQQATEMYIPIGASPGVSGKASVVGTIATVETEGRRFSVKVGDAAVMVTIPETAPVWLDRSRGKGPNRAGSPLDLKPGLSVEVKSREALPAESITAEWVKVAVTD